MKFIALILSVLVPLLAGCHSLPDDRPADLRTLGGCTIDVTGKTVTLAGWVNMVEGPLEYLICGPQGKTHESLFVSAEPPENLQAAVLLLGVSPGIPPDEQGVGHPRGPEFEIWVEWQEGDTLRRARAESMIKEFHTKSAFPDVTWVFTGSQVLNGKFKANVYGSFAVTYWDPWAIFNINHDVGEDDELLSVYTEATPPEGTDVSIEFRLKKR